MQPTLIITYDGSESARDNLGEFIYEFQPETKISENLKGS